MTQMRKQIRNYLAWQSKGKGGESQGIFWKTRCSILDTRCSWSWLIGCLGYQETKITGYQGNRESGYQDYSEFVIGK